MQWGNVLIAGILGSLDEKIEVNRRKIAELEDLAKTIYDYWFVQFDFPDANGRPYKTSGGEMVWYDKLKRALPKDWVPRSVSQCGIFHHGVTYSKDDELSASAKDAMPVYRGNNIANGFVIYDSNEVFVPSSMVSTSQILKRGNLLIAMSSGSKAHVGKAGLITYNKPERAFGAFCTSFEPCSQYRYLIFNFFWSKSYRAYIQQICSGTGINNLKPEHFNTDLLAVPQNEKIIDSFNKQQKPIFDRIMDLDEESIELSKLRDSILPLLINGQVEVK